MVHKTSILLAITLAACAQKPSCDSGDSHPDAFVDTADKWPVAEVQVCWEDLGQSTVADRYLVEASLTDEVTAKAGIAFIGWDVCPGPDDADGPFDGIRVDVQDVAPKTRGLGTKIRGLVGGITLNFTFEN